jgi:uncharacterized protein YdaU (DUF1376 family)
VNFYKRFIGDIQRDTGHLSCAEMGVYDRLLDHYYATEQPLPPDIDACCRIARAMTKDERKAVESILRQFFTLNETGYMQGRAERELLEAQPKLNAARTNGAKGGRPKKNPSGNKNETQEKPTGFLNETQHESSPEPEPELKPSGMERGSVNQPSPNPALTSPGLVCKALREAGMQSVNPTHPTLIALVGAGATIDEFLDVAVEQKARPDGKFNFAYVVNTVKGRREDAARLVLHQGAMPTAGQPNKQEALENRNRQVAQEWKPPELAGGVQ